MSLGFYKVIQGAVTVSPHQSPDGDSIRFLPAEAHAFDDIPHRPTRPMLPGASYQLRLQAIDTPELHYGSAEQPYGREARNGLLAWFHEDGATPFWDWKEAPATFPGWSKPAAILCDAFESHGRPISFLFDAEDLPESGHIELTPALLRKSYNLHIVEAGLAYLGLYAGGLTPATTHVFTEAYMAARAAGKGFWPADETAQVTVRQLPDISVGTGALIYAKIFRRCVDALKWAGGTFEPGNDLDDFLVARPTEDDHFIVRTGHAGVVRSRLSTAIEQVNADLRISVDLNLVEFISK